MTRPAFAIAPGARAGRRSAAALAAAASLLVATAATASEGGEHHAPSLTLLLLNFINFGIYAFILYRFAWPAVTRYLGERRAGVVAALEAARQARAEAEALKAEYDAKLRTLQADAERARAEVVAIAEVEAKNLLEQARHAAERIRNDARLVAEQEVTRARHALQEESAALVARIAGDLVAKQLTSQDQARFVTDFLAQARETADEAGAGAR